MFGARKCWVPVYLWTLSCVFLSALIIDFRQVFFDKCMSEWVSEYIWSRELRWEVTVLTSYKLKAWGLYSPCPEPKELEYLTFLICRITMIWENPANQQPWFQRYSQPPRCLSAFLLLLSSQEEPLAAGFVWGRSPLSGKEGHKLEWQLSEERLGYQLEGLWKGLPIPLYFY